MLDNKYDIIIDHATRAPFMDWTTFDKKYTYTFITTDKFPESLGFDKQISVHA